jgi:hypothetical protein
MSVPYRRPTIAPTVFGDADGRVIEYGDRWPDHTPPADSYSVNSNLERFAPLHRVAEALLEWLITTYDVCVDTTWASRVTSRTRRYMSLEQSA